MGKSVSLLGADKFSVTCYLQNSCLKGLLVELVGHVTLVVDEVP